MPHRPIAVANEFIRLHGADGHIDHLKLQKLVYFAQGWWLAFKGTPLVSERPQVWRYGPVFQSLYQIFSLHGRAPITRPRGANPFGIGNGEPPTLEDNRYEEEQNCIAWIWQEYGGLSGSRLSDLTHDIGTPWREIAAKNNFKVPLNTEIPENADWAYFANLAKERGLEPEELRN